MECKDTYASGFIRYLKDFVSNIRPDDPLPVRAPSYKVTESEIDGQILDIVHHYLNSRECPPYVREYVGHRVWTDIRNLELNGDGMEDELDGPNTNTTNHTYDSMKLIQEVTSKANNVIRQMADELTVEEVDKFPRYHPISHFAIKNTRRKMEDRHVMIHDLNTLYGMKYDSPHAYYGVFDGHAGTDAAVYSAAHLHQYMIQNPQYETNPEAALKHAFHITDTNFIKKAAKERLKGGTTAVVALVREKRLVVAWLGDSQALLVRRRNPVRMVEPHKPELPVERERVEEMGGCVINIQGTWRVLGQLAVSRAIGDADYKPYVSSECDIKSLEIEGDEDFLVLACDGLWDTLSAQDAVNVVYAYLTHNNGDTDGVGRCLVEAARSTGSEDNITAVVVFLRPVATLMEEEAQRIAQGQVPDEVPSIVMEKSSTPSSINAIFSPPIFSPSINQFEMSENNTSPNFFNMDDDFANGFPNNHYNDDSQDAAAPTSAISPMKDHDEPMEGTEAPVIPPQDYDSDEGVAVGAEGTPATEPCDPREAPTPTAEEVDAALAELDSIPDGVCESGEIDEEEEEEEEWSYYRMEPQTQPQGEDVLSGGAPSATVVPPTSEDFEVIAEPSDMVHEQDILPVQDKSEDSDKVVPDHIEASNIIQPKNELREDFEKDLFAPMEADEAPLVEKIPDIIESNMDMMVPSLDDHPERLINFSGPGIGMEKADNLMDTGMEGGMEGSSPHGSGSPRVPGSPRSVEGFVTSVELNTPDESFATNFAVNQAQDAFAGGVDQPSGPFSVYVSSSPEPASLDPPMQSSVDLFNMPPPGMTNGQVEEERSSLNQTPEPHKEESPVEIVHAQSTVEVVAPPSPVDVSGPETQFIMPEDNSASDVLISAEKTPVDISFVPQPVIEPIAEVPVPCYVDDTPVSEPDFLPDTNSSASPSVPEDLFASRIGEDLMSTSMHMTEPFSSNFEEVATEISSTVESFVETNQVDEISSKVESFVETNQMDEISSKVESFVETNQVDEISSKVESFVETNQVDVSSDSLSRMESTMETFSHMASASETISHIDSASETISHMESTSERFDSAAELTNLMELENKQNETSQITSPEPAVSPVQSSPEPAVSPVQSSPLDIPEKESETIKSPQPAEAETLAKVTKAPVKSTTEKAPAKATPGKATPGKATPGKATPGKATPAATKTPSRTPSTRTPTTRTPTPRTPTTKPAEKKTPITKSATPSSITKTTTAKPSTARPTTTRPTSAKPTTKPDATKPAAKPAPTRTTTTTTRAPLSTSRPAAKPTGATAPRTGVGAKPTSARPTPTARTSTTTARKPLDSAKSTDKTDGNKLVNGSSSRPTSRPGTARSTTSTTTARKPLSSTTKSTTKPAAEKETKNTTNQILSTRPTKSPASARTTATRTTPAHSTARTASKVTESAKTRMTSTTKTTASKTTGAATKKTLVIKSKTAAGAKESSVKKTEASVIDKTEPLVNGENKIADEETSVEVIEKCAVEDTMQASSEKVISETMTSSEQVVVSSENMEVLVNGDH